MECALGILKGSFRELDDMSILYIALLPYVAIVCCLLHYNVLLGQSPKRVLQLLNILVEEGA